MAVLMCLKSACPCFHYKYLAPLEFAPCPCLVHVLVHVLVCFLVCVIVYVLFHVRFPVHVNLKSVLRVFMSDMTILLRGGVET